MELARMQAVNNLLYKWPSRKEQMWRQEARVTNLKIKDSNTKFFHEMANVRRRRRQITSLKVGNNIVRGVGRIKKEIENHVKKHFG